MITLSEEKPCIDADVVRDLHETYEALQNEPKNNLEQSLPYYINKQYEFDAKLKKDCDDLEDNIDESIAQDVSEDSDDNIENDMESDL